MTCTLLQGTAPVVENVRLAQDTYRLRFHYPKMAASIRPGQFLMLRVPGKTDPLLGRAFALYDTAVGRSQKPEVRSQKSGSGDEPEGIDIVYLVVGKMTALMAKLQSGDDVEVWGPLGNGFPDYSGVDHLIMVAGGIGQTPFLALINRVLGRRGYGGAKPTDEVKRTSIYYGTRTKDLLAGISDFQEAGAQVHIATDDGTSGYKGLVTQLLDMEKSKIENPKSKIRLAGCGPEPMLHALADLAGRWEVPCDLSLETPMACGVGICFSCVTRVRTDRNWDYRRVCVEGPIFDAAKLIF